MSSPARVVVVGNPNTGKSTLFNALTGGNARVGNFPGTTVGTNRATLQRPGGPVELVDVPGTYSLAASSPDERVAIDAVLGTGRAPAPTALLVLADAPRLVRSLYLVLQLIELSVPVVLAVNLLDEAREAGIDVDLAALSADLGVPVIGTVARQAEGVLAVLAALDAVLADPSSATPGPLHPWTEAMDTDCDAVSATLPPHLAAQGAPGTPRGRAMGRWALLSADPAGRLPGEDKALPAIVVARRDALAAGRDLEAELVGTRYAWLDARRASWLGTGMPPSAGGWSERVDRVALHPVAGTAMFLLVMGLTFTALFSWADPMIGAIEGLFGWAGGWVSTGFDRWIAAAPAAAGVLVILRDLTVDGLIGGVGGVLVFLPQIALLFLFLAILEDCGYLARAAHLADRVLRTAGLPGKAFVPLLSGYACAVPAIMATRTMPRRRDRLVTMMVLPLTSCSARLPVYTLLIAALFPATIAGFVPLRPLMLAGMYVFSTLLALIAAVVIGRTVMAGRAEPSLIELPPYRVPGVRVVLRTVWARSADFVREAGGIILVATVLLWGLLYFPRYEPEQLLSGPEIAAAAAQGEDLDALIAPLALERSFGGRLGKFVEPAIQPLGYDWRIGIGLVGAFAAREVFVSTMGVVYGIGADADEESAALRDRLRAERRPDGTPRYTPLTGVSLMVFFAIALQCLSTLAVLKKEAGSWRWPAFTLVWMNALAWVAALLVYQGGRLLGLG